MIVKFLTLVLWRRNIESQEQRMKFSFYLCVVISGEIVSLKNCQEITFLVDLR